GLGRVCGSQDERERHRPMVPPCPDGTGLRRGHGLRTALGFALSLGRLSSLLGPWLVELDAPLAVLRLRQGQPGAEALARAALEAGHRLPRASGLYQLPGHGERQLLTGLRLPDHEA